MPNSDTAQTTPQKEEPTNLTFHKFLKITAWVLKTLYKMYPGYLVVNVISSMFQDVQGIVSAYIISKLLDQAIKILQGNSASLASTYPYIGFLAGYSLFAAIINYLSLFTERAIESSFRPKIEELTYNKLRALGIQTLEDPTITNKISRSEYENYAVINFYFRLTTVLGILASIVITGVLMLRVAPEIIPLVLILSIPIAVVDKYFIKKTWRFNFDNTEARRKAYSNANVLTFPAALKEIFINGAHNYLSDKFTSFANWFYGMENRMRRKWFLFDRAFGFIADLGVYVGYLIVFSKFLSKKITIGDTLFNIRLIDRLSNDVSNITGRFTSMYEYGVRIQVVYDLLNLESTYPDGEALAPVLKQGPDISVRNVTFRYPKAEIDVLENFSLDIKSGEKVAIVGHNGAGKTTLVKLLCRIYPATRGEVLINGENINDFNSASYYKNIGVLFQDYNEYNHLTVRENVVIGNPEGDYDEEKVLDSLKKADALGFVSEYKNGLDQILSERFTGGIRPSTGQWQKIAIARFFYRNAPFVIFDEPTAAIDAVSEYNIFNKIYEFFEGKTVILISHRFSTVRNADRIIVMENGHIIEQGTHKELVAANGYYAKSFRLQAEGYADQVESIV